MEVTFCKNDGCMRRASHDGQHDITWQDRWLNDAERKLREAIYLSLAKGDWQAVYEDALIGRAVFGRKEVLGVSGDVGIPVSCHHLYDDRNPQFWTTGRWISAARYGRDDG